VSDANVASQPEVVDAVVTAARDGRKPSFSRGWSGSPVGACERGCANPRSRGTAVFADGLFGQRLIVEIDALADLARLLQLDLTVLDLGR
jgi:hypothetical protein